MEYLLLFIFSSFNFVLNLKSLVSICVKLFYVEEN
jgi:hypothetical protein